MIGYGIGEYSIGEIPVASVTPTTATRDFVDSYGVRAQVTKDSVPTSYWVRPPVDVAGVTMHEDGVALDGRGQFWFNGNDYFGTWEPQWMDFRTFQFGYTSDPTDPAGAVWSPGKELTGVISGIVKTGVASVDMTGARMKLYLGPPNYNPDTAGSTLTNAADGDLWLSLEYVSHTVTNNNGSRSLMNVVWRVVTDGSPKGLAAGWWSQNTIKSDFVTVWWNATVSSPQPWTFVTEGTIAQPLPTTSISRDQVHTYNILQGAAQNFVASYSIRAARQQDQTASFYIRGAALQSGPAHTYNIRGGVFQNVVAAYNVRGDRAREFTDTYQINGASVPGTRSLMEINVPWEGQPPAEEAFVSEEFLNLGLVGCVDSRGDLFGSNAAASAGSIWGGRQDYQIINQGVRSAQVKGNVGISNYTVFLVIDRLGAGAANSEMGGLSDPATQQALGGFQYTTGAAPNGLRFATRHGTTAANSYTIIKAFQANRLTTGNERPVVLAASVGFPLANSTTNIYFDGVLDNGTVTNTGTISVQPVSNLRLIGCGGLIRNGEVSAGNADRAFIMTMVFDRIMTPYEIAYVSENWKRVYRPRRVLVPVASSLVTTPVSQDFVASYRILQGVLQSGPAHTYNIRAARSADYTAAYAIRGQATQDSTTSYNVRGLITQDSATSFYIRGATSRDFADLYGIGGSVFQNFVDSYGIAGRVFLSSFAMYNIRGLRQQDQVASYNVLGATAQNFVDSYAIRAGRQADYVCTYMINGRVFQDQAAAYNIVGSVAQPFTDQYNIRAARSADFTASYTIAGRPAQDQAATYNIRGAVTRDFVDAFSIRAARSADFTASYRIVGKVSQDYLSTYGIRTLVTQDSSVNYFIGSSVTADYIGLYNVIGRATQDFTDAYSVRAGAVRDYIASYNVRGAAALNFVDSYRIVGLLASDFTDAYSVRAARQQDSTVAYNIVGQVAQSFTADYVIRAAVGQNYASVYEIRGLVEQSFVDAQYILGRAQADSAATYNILNKIYQDFSDEWAGSNNVEADFSDEYNVRGRALADFDDLYNIRTEAVRNHVGAYGIAGLVEQDQEALYNIRAGVQQDMAHVYTILGRRFRDFADNYEVARNGCDYSLEDIAGAVWDYVLTGPRVVGSSGSMLQDLHARVVAAVQVVLNNQGLNDVNNAEQDQIAEAVWNFLLTGARVPGSAGSMMQDVHARLVMFTS